MNVPNHLIKQKLQNVFFILGSNCGGKSSMAKALAEKHDMVLYSADEHYWNHRKQTDSAVEVNMNRPFHGWDEYFSRNPRDQAKWLLRCKDEEIPYILCDLMVLASSTDKKIIVDTHNMGDLAKEITNYNRVIYLYADEETVRNDFFEREDKLPLLKVIQTKTTHPDKALNNLLETVSLIARSEIDEALSSNFKTHQRTLNISFEERMTLVEKHFKL